MDGFIKLSNFSLIAPYAELFQQGMLVTVLLSLFTVAIDEAVQFPASSFPWP